MNFTPEQIKRLDELKSIYTELLFTTFDKKPKRGNKVGYFRNKMIAADNERTEIYLKNSNFAK